MRFFGDSDSVGKFVFADLNNVPLSEDSNVMDAVVADSGPSCVVAYVLQID